MPDLKRRLAEVKAILRRQLTNPTILTNVAMTAVVIGGLVQLAYLIYYHGYQLGFERGRQIGYELGFVDGDHHGCQWCVDLVSNGIRAQYL